MVLRGDSRRSAVVPTSIMACLRRALVAGALAGLCAALYLLAVGERSLEAALALEAPSSEPEMFSRGTQVAGGVVAAMLLGILLSIVFGTVFAKLRHRLAGRDDLRRSLVLATTGFVAVSLLPALKYPANPPGVGDPGNSGQRSLAYLLLVLAALALSIGIWGAYDWLHDRMNQPTAVVLTVVVGVTLTVALLVAMPSPRLAIPETMPAGLLWRFRLHSIGSLVVLWATLGLAFGWLCSRNAAREQT